MTRFRSLLALTTLVALAATPIPSDMLHGLVWRSIGPFRGGRISSASGAIGEPGTFYVGTPAGGVWKTTSAGEVWFPVFDGCTASPPSAPSRSRRRIRTSVYVGTGDQGDRRHDQRGQRTLQVDRRRPHLDAHRSRGHQADPGDPGRSARRGHVPRRRGRQSARQEQCARHLSQHRRWRDLHANALRERFHGRAERSRARTIGPTSMFATTIKHYFAPLPPSGISAGDAAHGAERADRNRHVQVRSMAAPPGRNSPAAGCRASAAAPTSPSR